MFSQPTISTGQACPVALQERRHPTSGGDGDSPREWLDTIEYVETEIEAFRPWSAKLKIFSLYTRVMYQ